MTDNFLLVSEEVKEAQARGGAVVALESTIIAHGMPYPANVETALRVEKIVRENGAVPATIAILGGRVVVGVDNSQIEYLGKKGTQIPKVSRRDVPVILARRQDGAATVAATMLAAGLAGIQVFATGGIGGVHRGAEKTMDISADLEELAKTDVLVVCAGAKAILDLGLTLEYLETKGVAVLGYQTDVFPAFYAARSEFPIPYRIESAKEAARVFQAKRSLGLAGGVVVANPIPQEHSLDYHEIEATIQEAVLAAQAQGIVGKEITPFLLEKVSELTAGASLKSNIELIYNNAELAAQIAVALGRQTA